MFEIPFRVAPGVKPVTWSMSSFDLQTKIGLLALVLGPLLKVFGAPAAAVVTRP